MQVVIDRQGRRIGFDRKLSKSSPEDLIVIMISFAELMFGASCSPKDTQVRAIHDNCEQRGLT
jgi:hypothetical protein